MGSGTSALAAIKEKRHYIGIDKEQQYVDLSIANITAFSQQGEQLTFNDIRTQK